MSAHFDLGKLLDLPSELRLSFKPGEILLDDERMIMLHIGAMGSLRKELVDSLGTERAKGLLIRMGFASGVRDARLSRKLMPDLSDEELMRMGPKLHTLEGVVDVTPIKIDIDIAQGHYFGDFRWENSFEADVHLEHYGVHTDAVCWMQIGYATGYTSEILGKLILYREPECRGKGDACCRNVGKPLEDWDDAVDEDLKYYSPDPIADQMLKLQEEVEHLRFSLGEQRAWDDMVGVSPPFKRVCELLKKAGESNATVLMLGEIGTGKEMCARALHSVSSRAENHFVSVNCAALPEELIESELFGVEKGAVTGALHSRPGRLERAHGGTLFLAEVNRLPASAQVRLLRFLRHGEFERIGDSQTRRVDVRLIAETNIDLQQAVKEGSFRADLYYRLNVFPLRIPTLRERKSDIPALAERFVQKYSALHGRRPPTIEKRALEALGNYHWPGNIRELENMIERGVILVGHQNAIDVVHLFPNVYVNPVDETNAVEGAGWARPQGDVDAMIESMLDDGVHLGAVEERFLRTAVQRANGNLSSAARALGITRPQLAYRLSKLEAH